MKKIFVVAILLLTLVVVFAAIFWEGQRPRKVETVLPEGPIYYVRYLDLARQMDEFASTKVWDSFKKIQVRDLLAAAGVAEQDLQAYDVVKNQLKDSSAQAVFKKLFGAEVAVAIYPAEIDDFNAEAVKELVSRVYVVTRITPDVQLAEVFPQVFSWINKDVSLTTAHYKNHKINIITTKDGVLSIGYTRVGNLLVMGFGEQAAKDCLDVLTRSKNALTSDPRFLKAKSGFMPNANMEGFFNWELLFGKFKEQMLKYAAKKGENIDKIRPQIEENLKRAEGFEMVTFSGVLGLTSRFKTLLSFDRNKLAEDIRQIYDCSPKENKTLPYVPQDVLGYQWSTCYDFSKYWIKSKEQLKQTVDQMGGGATPEQMIRGLEQNLGLSIEGDILPALGHEFGGALMDLSVTGGVPQVKLVMFLQVADRAKAQKVIETLIARQQFVMPQSEDYKGDTIKFFKIPILMGFQPGYVFSDQYLFLATDYDILKMSLDTRQDPAKSLAKSAMLQQADMQLLEPNNSLLFIRMNPAMGKVSGLLDWGNQWAATQEIKREAFISGAQKRLEDVQAQKKEAKEELAKAQQEKENMDNSLKNVVPVAPDEKSGLENQLSELKNTVADKQAQVEAAVAAGADAAPLKAEQEELVQKVSQLESKLKELADREAKAEVLKIQAVESIRRIEALQKEITDDDSKEQELRIELADYARQQPMPAELRETLIEGLAKPLFQGLANFSIFTMRTLFHPDGIEFFSYWTME